MRLLRWLWDRFFGDSVSGVCSHHWHTDSSPHRTYEKFGEFELIHKCCHCGAMREWEF